MNENETEYTRIIQNSTCDYDFKSDESGIIFTDMYGQISSIDFNNSASPEILLNQSSRIINHYFNLKIYENKLFYINEKAIWVKDLIDGGVVQILKLVEMGYFEFTPDWSHLIILDSDKAPISIYDRITLKLLTKFEPVKNHDYAHVVNIKIFFSSDSKTIYILRLVVNELENITHRVYDIKHQLIRMKYSKCLEGGDLSREIEYEVVEFTDDIALDRQIEYKPYL